MRPASIEHTLTVARHILATQASERVSVSRALLADLVAKLDTYHQTATMPLFAPPAPVRGRPVARRGDPDTSHAAAASITPEQLRDSQRAVLACLRELGSGTDEGIAEFYAQNREARDWPAQSRSGLRTRRSELSRGQDPIVRDSGQRITLESGREAIVWTVNEEATCRVGSDTPSPMPPV